ncbi:MAG: hypothetical protein KMY55_02370 [Dethiosulfatibacter sp.]|nr:hypothetical protein [Dethiosulfatibacter sp.]
MDNNIKSLDGFQFFNHPEDIPELWDDIAGNNIFLRRDALSIIQKANPCQQKYYINQIEKIIFVTYRLKINLFALTSRLKLNKTITIVGIPLSVSFKGYACKSDNHDLLSRTLDSIGKLCIVLNGDEDLTLIKGYTLSEYVMDIRWESMSDYINALRSHYRYRVLKSLKRLEHLKFEELTDNHEFSTELYAFYLEVYEKSQHKLEKLTIEFFRTFPSRIFVIYEKNHSLGFIQLRKQDDELIFTFCGFDHHKNPSTDLYYNMLLFIVQTGIECECKTIRFGQTTEESKAKIGAIERRKSLYIASNSKFVRFLGRKLIRMVSYKGYDVKHNVFKTGKCEK